MTGCRLDEVEGLLKTEVDPVAGAIQQRGSAIRPGRAALSPSPQAVASPQLRRNLSASVPVIAAAWALARLNNRAHSSQRIGQHIT